MLVSLSATTTPLLLMVITPVPVPSPSKVSKPAVATGVAWPCAEIDQPVSAWA